MNNKELFIDGFLDRISTQYSLSADPRRNRDTAFEIFAIATLLSKTPQEVVDQILVKGDKDGGFDGIYFENQGDSYLMHVFQCKNALGLKDNQIDKFRNDFRDVFPDGNRVGRQHLGDVQPFIDEYKQITSDGYLILPKLYFVFNGNKIDTTYNFNQAIYQAYHRPELDFLVVDSNDLYQKLEEVAQKRKTIQFTFRPVTSNISLLDSQGLYTFSIENIRAANCRVDALELCKLIDREVEVNGNYDTLFEENIRTYLGLKSARANFRMNETLSKAEDAIYFPFLNNGLTIICEQLTIPSGAQDRQYLLPIVNPQIVNGLQTSMVLYHNYKSDSTRLNNVFVNVRIYETKDPVIIEKITDATNTQSPINYRDKISNKGFNARTELVFKNAGIRYVLKRGDNFGKGPSRDMPSVDSDTVLKFWYATFFEKPEVAKNSIASVLQYIYDATVVEAHPLKELFNGDIDSSIYQQLLASYRIYRFVQKKKAELRDQNEIVNFADELLCYGIYKIIGKAWENYKNEQLLQNAYDETLQRIISITDADRQMHEQQGKNFYYNTFFKRPKSRIDYNREANILESETLIEDLQKA
jgi:hypothetical protein